MVLYMKYFTQIIIETLDRGSRISSSECCKRIDHCVHIVFNHLKDTLSRSDKPRNKGEDMFEVIMEQEVAWVCQC